MEPRAVLDALPDAVLILDGQGRICALNDAARRMGQAHQPPVALTVGDDLLGRLEQLYSPAAAERESILAGLSGVRERTSQHFEFDFCYPRDGEQVWATVTCVPCQLGEGRGLLVRQVDITRRKRTELALRDSDARARSLVEERDRALGEVQQAVAARDEFLSVAAHELKTPVTSLRGFAQLLAQQMDRAKPMDPARVKLSLGAIDRQSDKLARLVSQLLDISRLQSGGLTLDLKVADLMTVVQDAAATARVRSDRHTVGVRGPAELWARIDPLRVEQVVTNLIDNAMKYSPDGGPIDLEVTVSPERTIQIVVSDQGIGIPLEHRERVFQRFYQAHANRQLGGMGLGLYVSRQIIELHGGDIHPVYPKDAGTRMVVQLPVGTLDGEQVANS